MHTISFPFRLFRGLVLRRGVGSAVSPSTSDASVVRTLSGNSGTSEEGGTWTDDEATDDARTDGYG